MVKILILLSFGDDYFLKIYIFFAKRDLITINEAFCYGQNPQKHFTLIGNNV